MTEVQDLLATANFPRDGDNDLMKNFKSCSPPEVRHFGAFRGISKKLHISSEVVREKIFALTVANDLCRDDKQLGRNYDTLLELQRMDPETRAQSMDSYMIYKNKSKIFTNESTSSSTTVSDTESGDSSRERLIISISKAKINQKPFIKCKITNSNGNFNCKTLGNSDTKKSKTLRRGSNTPSRRKRSKKRQLSKVQLKDCYVKLIRLSELPNSEIHGCLLDESSHDFELNQSFPSSCDESSRKSSIDITKIADELHLLHYPVESTNTKPEKFVARIIIPKLEEIVEEKFIFDKIDKCPLTSKKVIVKPQLDGEQYGQRRSSNNLENEKNSIVPKIPPQVVVVPDTSTSTMDIILKKNEKSSKEKSNKSYPKYKDKYDELSKSIDEKRKYKYTSTDQRYLQEKVKVVGTNYKTKLPIENESLLAQRQPVKKFRIPFSFTANATTVTPPTSLPTPEKETDIKRRDSSYQCNWEKIQNQWKNMDYKYGNPSDTQRDILPPSYNKGSPKWLPNDLVWRKPKFESQFVPSTNLLNPGYFHSKEPGDFSIMHHPLGSTNYTESDIFVWPENFSTEVTTSNLISDAINQECCELEETVASSPEVIFTINGDYAVPPYVTDSTTTQHHSEARTGKLTAEVYVNYTEMDFSTSMFVDDDACYKFEAALS